MPHEELLAITADLRSNDAIFVNDPQSGLFIFVNDRACAGLGYDRGELLAMDVMDIEMTFPDSYSWEIHVNEMRQKGSLMLEGMHRRKDGTTFPVEANISYVALSNNEYMVAVVRDITERKQAAEELRLRERQLAESQRISHIGSWEHNLKTGRVFWSDELFRLLGLDPEGGRFVRISIVDSGIDIPEQNLERIFDPYFTTKQKGSGLGLATSYSIIRNHGGVIEVKSEVSKGSEFTIYLPAADEATEEEKASGRATVEGRKGRILFMDDEALMREVATELITALATR
jgi:PAS domain S-box-containing protein